MREGLILVAQLSVEVDGALGLGRGVGVGRVEAHQLALRADLEEHHLAVDLLDGEALAPQDGHQRNVFWWRSSSAWISGGRLSIHSMCFL